MRRVYSNEELCNFAEFDMTSTGELARLILAEHAEREKNPGVWDDAPDNARYAVVGWYEDSGRDRPLLKDTYHCRTLPKTKAREIAERATKALNPYVSMEEHVVSAIESAINEAMEATK